MVRLSFCDCRLSSEHRFLNFGSLILGLSSGDDVRFQNWFYDFGPRLSDLGNCGNFCGTVHHRLSVN